SRSKYGRPVGSALHADLQRRRRHRHLGRARQEEGHQGRHRDSEGGHHPRRVMVRSRRHQRTELGFTLIEVLIVVALIAILSASAIDGPGILRSSRLRGAASLIGSGVRLGLALANSTGHATRLTLDLDNEKVLLEEAAGSAMLRDKKAVAGGADPATQAE